MFKYITLQECKDILNEAAKKYQNSSANPKSKAAVAATYYQLELQYKNKKNTFGQCAWDRHAFITHRIIINGSLLSPMSRDDLKDTCRHEFAHFVIHTLMEKKILIKRVSPHGQEWKDVCKIVGSNGQRISKTAVVGVCGLLGYVIDNKKKDRYPVTLKKLNQYKSNGLFKSGRYTIKAADRAEIIDPRLLKDLDKFKL